jgi:hypothetical protein
VWVGEAVELALDGALDHAAFKDAGEQVMERIAGLMLRSAAATPLRGLELPGRWGQAAVVATGVGAAAAEGSPVPASRPASDSMRKEH